MFFQLCKSFVEYLSHKISTFLIFLHVFFFVRFVVRANCQSLPMPPREAERAKHTPSNSTPVWYTTLRRRAVQPNPSDSTLHLQVHYRPPMPKKKPPGRIRPARPPDERVDWLLL